MVRVKAIVLMGLLAIWMSWAFTCTEKRHKTTEETIADPEKAAASNVSEMEAAEDVSDTLARFSEVSEGTRKALIIACGRCHQSTLKTHKSGAIAIFDLDQGENWHGKLTVQMLEGISKRTENHSHLTKNERDQIKEFVALKRVQLQ